VINDQLGILYSFSTGMPIFENNQYTLIIVLEDNFPKS